MKKQSTRSSTHFCHWLGQAFIGLFKSGVSRPKESAFLLGASVMAMSSLTAVSAEGNESIEVLRPVTDQVAKSGEPYEVTLKPENYLSSDNLYQRFDIVPANGSSLPSWLTITKSAELEEILHRDVEDTFENADREGDLLFVAAGKAGIKVYNISNWRQPALLSIIDTPGYARGVDIQWPYMHVADGSEGYQIWNLTDGLFPKTFISQIKGIWEARDVRIHNHTTYIAAESRGIRIIDIKNLKHPIDLVPYTNTVTSRGFCWYNDFLLVANGLRGVSVYLIASPVSLKLVKNLYQPEWKRIDWVAIDGNYVVLRNNELTTIKLSFENIDRSYLNGEDSQGLTFPEQPSPLFISDFLIIFKEVDSIKLTKRLIKNWNLDLLNMYDDRSGTLTNMVEDKGALYCWNYYYGLRVFDVTNPAYPLLIASIDIVDVARNYGPGFLKLIDNKLWLHVHPSNSLVIIDVTYPDNPKKLNEIFFSDSISRFEIKDSLVYAMVNNHLQIINRANLSNPELLSDFQVSQAYSFHSLLVEDNILYTTSSENTLHIIDVDHPSAPNKLSSFSVKEWIAGIELYDNLIFLSERGVGIRVLDVSNKAVPREKAFYPLPYDGWSIKIKNNILFFISNYDGFMLFDVSNPDKMIFSGWSKYPFSSYGFIIAEDVIFLTSWDKLYSISLKNFKSLHKISHLTTKGRPFDLVLKDDYLYVSNYAYFHPADNGLMIFDFSNPLLPEVSSFFGFPGDSLELAIRDKMIYLASGYDGLKAIDVTNPNQPYQAGYFNPPGWSRSVMLRDNKVYISDDDGLFIIQDYSFKLNHFFPTSGWSSKAEVINDITYIDSGSNLMLLNITNNGNVTVLSEIKFVDHVISSEDLSSKVIFTHRDGGEGYKYPGVFDVTVPAEPVKIISYGFSQAEPVIWEGRYYLYFPGDDQLKKLEVGNPILPEVTFSSQLDHVEGDEKKVYFDDGLAFLTSPKRVDIFDASYPQASKLLTNATKLISNGQNYLVKISRVTLALYSSSTLNMVDIYSAESDILSLCCSFNEDFSLVGLGLHSVLDLKIQKMSDVFRPVVLTMSGDNEWLVTQAYYKILSLYKKVNNSWALVYELIQKEPTFNHVALSFPVLAVSLLEGGLELRNFSASGAGALLTTLPSVFPVTSVEISDSLLYVADPAWEVLLYDIQHPFSPRLTGQFSYAESIINKLVVKKSLLFASNGQFLLIVDASEYQNPLLVEKYDARTFIHDFIIDDNRIVLALGEQGIKVLQPKNNAKQWLNALQVQGERPAADKTIYSLRLIEKNSSNVFQGRTPAFKLNYQHPPIVSSTVSDRNVYLDDEIDIRFTPELIFTDRDNDPLTLSLLDIPPGLSFDSSLNRLYGRLNVTSPAINQRYAITIIANDGQGGEAYTTFNVRLLNRSPVFIAPLRPQTAKLYVPFSYTLSRTIVMDPENQPLMFTAEINRELSWLAFNSSTLTFKGVPTMLTNGAETVSIVVTDGAFSAISELSLSVVGSLSIESLAEAGELAYYEEEPLSLPAFSLSTPAGNASFTLTLSDRLAGQIQSQEKSVFSPFPGKYEFIMQMRDSLNSQLSNLTFVPARDYNKDLTINLVARDDLGQLVSQALFITGHNVNDPPELFNSIPELIANEGEQFTYTVPKDTFEDVDGDPLEIIVRGQGGRALPAGWTYYLNTQRLTGTPGTSEDVLLEAIAKDAEYSSLPHLFKIRVNEKASFIQKEDLIALVPIGLTVSLILATLALYKRARIKLKRFSASLARIDLLPLRAYVQNNNPSSDTLFAILNRLKVTLDQRPTSQEIDYLSKRLFDSVIHLSNGKRFKLVSHQAYLNFLQLNLLPSIRNEVLLLVKKSANQSVYSPTLIAKTSLLVKAIDLILLIDTKQGNPINETDRLEMLRSIQYIIRNLKTRITGYYSMQLELITARACLSSVRDSDNLLKFIRRVPGKVASTLIGFIYYNARGWVADYLEINYVLGYKARSSELALERLFTLQVKHRGNPVIEKALLSAYELVIENSAQLSLARQAVGSLSAYRGLRGLRQSSHPAIKEKAIFMEATLSGNDQSIIADNSIMLFSQWPGSTSANSSLEQKPVERINHSPMHTARLFKVMVSKGSVSGPLVTSERGERLAKLGVEVG